MLVPLEQSYLLSIFNFKNFTDYLPILGLLILLVILSSFFTIAEIAFSSVNIIRLRNYMEEKKRGAKKALYIAEKYDLTLTTILLLNNLSKIIAIVIFAYVTYQVITSIALASIIIVIVMTLILLIFTDFFPRKCSQENVENVTLKLAGVLYFFIKLFYPLTWLLMKLKKVIAKNDNNTPSVTEDELESIIDVMENEGVIEKNDAELIQSAIGLNDVSVFDIMTPRVDVIAVDVNDSIEEIKNMFFEYQFSRVPVYEDDKDNIIGILSERDFFTEYIKNQGHNINIRKLVTKPYYVSKTKKVDELIRELQQMKKHFAIVVDEYGGTSGIVTMEDALEELVGEIYDEYDDYTEEDDTEKIISMGDNKYLVSAEMDIEYLFEELKLGRVPETKFANIGGYIYELNEEIPCTGKSVVINTVYQEDDIVNPITHHYEVKFTIDKVSNRRIKTLIVEVKEIEHEDDEEDD